MDEITLRERLHEYIDTADERHLTAIYVLVENELSNNVYDEAAMKMFHQRRAEHLNGNSVSYTAEESLLLLRQTKK